MLDKPFLLIFDKSIHYSGDQRENIFSQSWLNAKSVQYCVYSRPESVHVGVDDHQDKGHNEVEDQPNVDHLDIGSGWQALVDLKQGDFSAKIP